MNTITSVVKRHPIAAFFVLAYTFSWWPALLSEKRTYEIHDLGKSDRYLKDDQGRLRSNTKRIYTIY